MNWKYPLVDPTLCSVEELLPLWTDIWESGMLTSYKYTRLLEEAVCEKTGVSHAVAFGSATSGIMLLLRALGCTGEVILPAYTFTASALALLWNGLTPVFVEIDPHTWTVDPAAVRGAVTERTSAIMAVDIFSLPANYRVLEEISNSVGVPLFVDSAQSLGATYDGLPVGGFTKAQVFSMSPTKVVVASEGGLLTTNDGSLAEELRNLRNYGKKGELTTGVGLSARMSELHAAIALTHFKGVDDLVNARNERIDYMSQALADLPGILFQARPEGSRMAGIYMTFRVDPEQSGKTVEALAARIESEGVMTRRFFYPALHQHPTYVKYYDPEKQDLSNTEHIAETTLSIPLYAHMDYPTMDTIIGVVRKAWS